MKPEGLRQDFKDAIMGSGHDDATAEVLLARIVDRLGGYTHAEVAEMHPLPSPTESEDA